MQVGLTMETQARLHAAITRRLSPTISFDDAYLALLMNDFDREPDPDGEDGKPLPAALPEFKNRTHHECGFQPHRVVNSRYLSFEREADLQANFSTRDTKLGVHLIGNYL